MSFEATVRLIRAVAPVLVAAWVALINPGAMPAAAQGCGPSNPGCIVPTAPAGTSDNRAASTAFVANVIPWCDPRSKGALGNAVTDDTAAFAACVTALTSTGGVIYVPNGNYCIKSGLSITGSIPITIAGPGLNSELQTCGADVVLLTLNNARHAVRDIVLAGSQTVGTTNDTISIGSSCTECLISHVFATGGRNVLRNGGVDVVLFDFVATQAYGGAIVYNVAASGAAQFWCDRCKIDQSYPVSTPNAAAFTGAWTSAHGYTAGQIATITQGGVPYLVQAVNSGTSGGSAPALASYNTTIADNTQNWLLVGRQTYAGIILDTGSSGVTLHQIDLTGSYTYGLYIENSLAGTAPQGTVVSDSSVGNAFTYGINFAAGAGLTVKGTQVANCINTGCAGINVAGTDASISGNLIFGNPIGILHSASSATVIGNQVFGASTACVSIAANQNNIIIKGNSLGSSTTWGACTVGVAVAAGTGDWIAANDNDFAGATTAITYAATGAHTDVYPIRTGFALKAVNFNSANSDNQFSVAIPPLATSYILTRMQLANASASISTATIGLFSASGGGGSTLIANSAITVTATAANTNNNYQNFASSGTTAWNFTTLFARIGTAQGSAATADVSFEFMWVY